MFDIGWSEMMVIALVALIVIGPKELPRTLKTVAQWMRKARSLSREFQSGIDEMVREAELDDARKALEATRHGNLERTISNAIDPDDEVASEVKGIEHEARRESAAGPAAGQAAAGPAAGQAAAAKDSNAERAASKIVTQPLSVAPAHSLKPPADKPSGSDTSETQPAPGSKQSA